MSGVALDINPERAFPIVCVARRHELPNRQAAAARADA
jgi:hypothetical protein